MKYSIHWTKIAETDLEAIIEYIAYENIQAADELLENIKTLVSELTSFPERSRIVPELREFGMKKFRELIYKHWRIIYCISDESIAIYAIFDSRRDLNDLLLERLL
jgi:plasmid stabilization system protein ParE